MTVEAAVLWDVTKLIRRSLVDAVTARLQNMPAGLSGDDSCLASAWEEICAQVQIEESMFWDAYLLTIEQTVMGELYVLPEAMQQALSIQTPDGEEWLRSAADGEMPIFEDDIVRIVQIEVIEAAERYDSRSLDEFRKLRYG